MRRLILTALLALATLSLSATVKDSTISGTIKDWEAGKTGEVQLNISSFSPNFLDILDPIATAAVGKDGQFTLRLPDAAKLKAALKPASGTYALNSPCRGNLTVQPAAALTFFDLTGYSDGIRIAGLRQSNTPLERPLAGDAMSVLVYASSATKLTGTSFCSISPHYNSDGPYTYNWNADLKAGDLILSVDGKDVTGLNPVDIAKLIRGQPDSEVTIVVKRGEQTLTLRGVRAFRRF